MLLHVGRFSTYGMLKALAAYELCSYSNLTKLNLLIRNIFAERSSLFNRKGHILRNDDPSNDGFRLLKDNRSNLGALQITRMAFDVYCSNAFCIT